MANKWTTSEFPRAVGPDCAPACVIAVSFWPEPRGHKEDSGSQALSTGGTPVQATTWGGVRNTASVILLQLIKDQ